ncbi:MAG TPA: hypothetical protein PLU21_04375 [Candidatus Saccharibacteria bacterium]|nr:hypothetical protein [Candidatus Saccharibacteria bacterium]
MSSTVLLVIVGVAWWYISANNSRLNNVDAITSLVSRHMLLPGGEKPALATVTDTTKLNTEFLKQAENGDKLLIYEKAKLVVVYRPSIDKIVTAGPISIESLTDASK